MHKLWQKYKTNLSPWFFLLPGLIVFLLFKYYPIILGVVVSFFKFEIMNPPGDFIGLGNYIRAFNDSGFIRSIKNSFGFLFVIMIFNFWVPILLAIFVNEIRNGQKIFRFIYFVPAVIPPVVMAVLWKYIWQPDYGFANYILNLLNLSPQMWLNSQVLVKWCMRFPYFIMAGAMSGGIAFIIYLATLHDIPKSQIESSLIDGANFLQRIRYIVLPQILPIVSIMFILTMIDVFNYFDEPMIMTGGGPAGSTETMVMYAFKRAYQGGKYGFGLAISTINLIIVFIFTVIQMKFSSND